MGSKLPRFLILILLWQAAEAQLYELQISVDGAVNNSSNVTVNQNLIGETLKLECSSNDCMTDARLEWLDGRIPIRESLANLVLERNGTAVALYIYNFTADNYGQYRCRCVKEYSNPTIISETEHAGFDDPNIASKRRISRKPFCNDQEYIVQLLPNNQFSTADLIREQYVTRNVNMVQNLSCSSGYWRIWKAYSVPESIYETTYSALVTTSMDQGKLICLSPNKKSVQKIYYISIKDYFQFPLGFNRPFRRGDELVLDEAHTHWPLLCVSQPYLPSDLSLTLAVNGTDYASNSNLKMARVSYHSNPENSLHWAYLVTFTFFSTATREIFQYSNFSCRASSYWEDDVTVDFRIIHPSEVVTMATSTTVSPCPTATSSSMHLSSSEAHSSLILIPSHSTSIPSYTPSLVHHSKALSSSVDQTTTVALVEMKLSSRSPILNSTSSPPPIGSKNINIIVFSIVGAATMLTIVAFIVVVIFTMCLRRKSKSAGRRRILIHSDLSKEQFLEYSTDPQLMKSLGMDHHLSSMNSHRLMLCNLQKTPWYFPYERLEMCEDLGSGAFGMVKKAIAHNIQPDEPSTIVAVKMLKETRSDEDEKDLISELKVLQHVGSHVNIVNLLGASIHQSKLQIIVEYCGNGSLLHYLRSKRGDMADPLTCKHFMDMASQVAAGMEHLTAKKCIHRDLAARNVLVTEDLVLKVADFGLARKIYDSIYRPSGGRVPVKWMAPETILDGEYTSQSDVWSFGVLLWEILTLGKSPYPGKSPEEVIQSIDQGYRMPQPSSCPPLIYSLLLKCWDKVPTMRPNFADLCVITESLKQQFEAMDVDNYDYCILTLNNVDGCQPAMMHGETWLENHHDVAIELDSGRNVVTLTGKDDTSSLNNKFKAFLSANHRGNNYGMLGRANSLLYVNTTSSSNGLSIKHSSSASYLPILCSSKDYLPMLPVMVNKNINPLNNGGHDSGDVQTTLTNTATGCHRGSLQLTSPDNQLCSNHEPKLSHSVSLESVCSNCRNGYSISSASQLSSVVGTEEDENGSYRSLPRHFMARQNTYQNMKFPEEKSVRKASEKSCDSGVVTSY